MIIKVCGTSGSGKSTAVRGVMEHFSLTPCYVPGRKRPLYYRATNAPLIVLGHYEIDCGGCDTIGSAPKVYNLLRDLQRDNPATHFVTEGLLWAEDVKWTVLLPDVRALFLITDPETCLTRIKDRQAGRVPADAARVRRKMETRVGTIDRARLRLSEAGVLCRRVSAEQAPGVILSWLNEARLHARRGV